MTEVGEELRLFTIGVETEGKELPITCVLSKEFLSSKLLGKELLNNESNSVGLLL